MLEKYEMLKHVFFTSITYVGQFTHYCNTYYLLSLPMMSLFSIGSYTLALKSVATFYTFVDDIDIC